jgi:DNA-binding SARP family transcriptional activator
VAGQSSLRVELFGGFRFLVDGRPSPRQPTTRQQQLLAFLILYARAVPVPRQRVAGSLWPDSTDEQALTNLRRELHNLRENCPKLEALIEAGARTIAWQATPNALVDVVAFEAAADRGLRNGPAALEEASLLYKGPLLPDCQGEWIEDDRERLRLKAKQVLERLVTRYEKERAFGNAIEQAQRLLQLDRLDEQAWCALMRAHARRGERAAALHLYQQCAAVLKKELGVQPSAATRATYREILDLDTEVPSTPAPARAAAYPLVGRQPEFRALLAGWRAAASGSSRCFLVRGEAGIGKTRLAEEMVQWCGVNGVVPLSARCYAGEGRLAYAPIATWLKSDALQPTLTGLDALWLTDVARLHPGLLANRSDVPAPDRALESWQRLRFFEALAQAFRAAAPLVLVLDDAQWADGDTLEWIQYFTRADARCLVLATVRAEEEQDNPPLGRLIAHLERDSRLTAITLGPLDRTATAQLAGEVAERPLDEATLARTFRETEGHPFFIVEYGRMEAASQAGTAPAAALPSPPVGAGFNRPLESIVAARLALLSDEARATAEVASAVGRDFRFDILAQASDLEEDALVRALDELWRRHIVRVQAEERWDFSHDRIREAAYAAIGPARRRLIHRRIAQGMELLFADRLGEVSAAIAVHLERGGQPARAVPFLARAGAVASHMSAHEEAVRCLTHAVALLDTLPAGRERDAQELELRSSLSVALNVARGYAVPDVEQNLARLITLSSAGDPARVPVRWLWVAFTLRFMLGDLEGTREVAEQALAASLSDPSCLCEAHHAMGGTLLYFGELDESKRHFEAALAAYDEARPQRSALGSDLGVFGHSWYSHTLWMLGDEAAAVSHVEEAIALAERLDHKYSQTLALAYAALLHQMRRDAERTERNAEAVVELCDRYGFAYYGDWARALIGWARGLTRPAEGVALIESALERLDRNRAQARRPYYLSLLAETCQRLGNRERAASIVESAIAMSLARHDVWWLPALYLQKSELVPAAEREPLLQQALELARAHHSRALEQRILNPVGK